LGDFVELAPALGHADVVTLDRVICCYGDMPRLVELSAARARRIWAAVYPRDEWWTRLAFRAINAFLRLRRTGFRVFVHAPSAIADVLRASGLQPVRLRRTLVWEVAVYRRPAPGTGAAAVP